MATDIGLHEIIKTRQKTLDILINRVNSWDKSPESAIDIVEKNKVDLENLQFIQKTIESNFPSYRYEDYIEKIELIYRGEKDILACLSKRKEEVKNIMLQINNKNKIKDNYLKQNKKSLFIDRDF